MNELAQRYELRSDLSVSVVSRYPDIFTIHKTPENEDAVWSAVRIAVDHALERFIAMRETEGARLKADVLGRAGTILALVEKIEERSPHTVSEYRQRLEAKIKELL